MIKAAFFCLPGFRGSYCWMTCLSCLAMLGTSSLRLLAVQEVPADVCVYGGTSGGVIAAVQAARMGKTVVLVSPVNHLGGMTSSGLGWTDLGSAAILGGLSREFYHRAYLHYQDDSAWDWQTQGSFGNTGQNGPAFSDATQLASVFEPSVAEGIFDQLIAEHSVPIYYARLNLTNGVVMRGQRIIALRTEDGTLFRAQMFIDATYEGDLMAKAGVSYTVGREANAVYGEVRNGIQSVAAVKNQLPNGVDPYVVSGNAASGLLPGVNPDAGGADGAGDDKLQAYCYRMVLTDVAANRVAVAQPTGYDADDYELLFRSIAAGQTSGFFKFDLMPNRKTDSNNSGGISTDLIGGNYGADWNWAEASHAQREAVALAHRKWQLGLIWTLQNHPSVPSTIRNNYAKWGLPADEFADNDHWPYQIYVREARRMVADYVMTRANCTGAVVVPDPVGLAAYQMDSHNTQRHVKNGQVKNEGDVQDATAGPYPVAYRSIVPKLGQCENLLVPWCLSASHIAFGSIRMEPVFMILSQSAATAACMALDDGVAVQNVNYSKLQAQLLADGQALGITERTTTSNNVVSLLLDFGPTAIATTTEKTNDPAHAIGGLSMVQNNWNTSITADKATGTLVYSDGTAASGVSLDLGRSLAGGNSINFNDNSFLNSALGASISTGIYAGGSPAKDGVYGGSGGSNAYAIGLRVNGLSAGTYTVYFAGRNTSTAAETGQRFYCTNGPAATSFAFQTAPVVVEANSSPALTSAFALGNNCQMQTVTLTAGDSLYLASVGIPTDVEQRGFLNAVGVVPGLPAFLTNLPVVTLWASDATAARLGPQAGSITIRRTINTNVAVTVFLNIGGTAVNGVDYQALASSLVLPAGVAITNISLLPYTNVPPAGDKTVTISLVPHATYATGTLTSAMITIKAAPLQAWRWQYFGPNATNTSLAGDAASPAGDHIPNLMKYALGLVPTNFHTAALITPWLDMNGYFTAAFTRPDPSPLDISYWLEASDDLASWATNVNLADIVYHADNTTTLLYRTASPVQETSQGFLRLRVTRK